MSLCCIFYYRGIFTLGKLYNSIHITRMSVKMHRNYVFYIRIGIHSQL